MNYHIFIFIFIIIVGCWLYYGEKKNYNRAPQIIWTYWDDPKKIPKTVELCIKGWKKWNPNYKVILLTKKNYKGYVTIPEELIDHPNFNDCKQRFSDLVRIWTLAEHGGVWIDSSILLKGPLDWLFPRYAEFSGFYLEKFTNKKEWPVLENWFFACNKGSPFVKLWRDEFSKMVEYPNVEHYLLSRIDMGVDFQGIDIPNYLAMHIACQKVIQLDKYPIESLYLQKAEDGPYRYIVDAKWDSEKAVELACASPSYQSPIMKMRGGERDVLEKRLDYDLTPEKCGWAN